MTLYVLCAMCCAFRYNSSDLFDLLSKRFAEIDSYEEPYNNGYSIPVPMPLPNEAYVYIGLSGLSGLLGLLGLSSVSATK